MYEFFLVVLVLVLDLVVAAAAGATASASVLFSEIIFGVVAVPIAWNATNALYEFFVVVPGLVLGLGLVCLVVISVVLFLSDFCTAICAIFAVVVVFVFDFYFFVSASVIIVRAFFIFIYYWCCGLW